MRISVLVASALQALKGNARRTILTMIGIIIGIAAVITIISIGKGFQRMTISQINGEDQTNGRVSVNFYYVSHAPGHAASENSEVAFSQQDRLGISKIEGVLSTEIPKKEERTEENHVEIHSGSKKEIVDLRLLKSTGSSVMLSGEALTQADIDTNQKVVVIPASLATTLYRDYQKAIGRALKIKEEWYFIKGVKEDKQTTSKGFFDMGNRNKEVEMPFSTYSHYHPTRTAGNRLLVVIKPGYTSKKVAEKVQEYLNKKGSLHRTGQYSFFDQGELVDSVGKVIDSLTYFVSAVAGISLFIAGVGVMNMMYISVSERTKEIGIRRSMGATKGSIQLQFLLEGVVITSLGGIVGYIFGILFAKIIAAFLPFDSYTDVATVLLAIGISATIGIIFSVFPAKAAAKKDVVDILR